MTNDFDIFFLVRIFRSKAEATESFKNTGFIELEETDDGEVALKQCHFKWDKLCPLFLSCIPLDRSQFAKSVLMKEQQFIMQVAQYLVCRHISSTMN